MSLRDLPAVDRLLKSETAEELISTYGRSLTVEALRQQLAISREAISQGGSPPKPEDLLRQAQDALAAWVAPTLRNVINATGVIIHTNLGRAPLSEAARQAVLQVAKEYSTLEYDLPRGKRGKRDQHAEDLLIRLTGAEAALVVNNNAAAVLLGLTGLARRKQVLISRSQLIEIGGGFRVPEVMKQSGAKLVEVGTTNRTHLKDFEAAMHERVGLILRAHHSNFRIVGFTTEPTLKELVDLGRRFGVPVMDDLGSGALLDTDTFGLGHEPTVQESLQAGAALVAFSGDKLLGGPQAGILLGEKKYVDRLRRHPLARALRPDKLCLAALTATLLHYLKAEATEAVPVWRMIAASSDSLQARVKSWAQQLEHGEVLPGRSPVGGGSLPEQTLPTWLLALEVPKPNAFAAKLRQAEPPIIARIEEDKVVFDPRTILPEQDEALLQTLEAQLS
ncbi:MAG: L-seryl-tRNA(Sec) selenium transferase [Anaerolineales bacterium]